MNAESLPTDFIKETFIMFFINIWNNVESDIMKKETVVISKGYDPLKYNGAVKPPDIFNKHLQIQKCRGRRIFY